MTTTEEDLGLRPESAAEEARGTSLLREAERRREQASANLFIEVPSWGGDLIAEYRVVERQRLEQLITKIQREQRNGSNSGQRTAADIDLLVEANVGLYAFDADAAAAADDEAAGRVPIADEMGTVTYGRIGPVLGREFRSVREAVLYLMKDNGVAISAHASVVARWMRDPSKTAATLMEE
jgi:hypothetical protein